MYFWRPQLPGTSDRGRDPPLYDVWGTSYKALDEFGIGVGLYFRQLLFLGIVSRAPAGLIHRQKDVAARDFVRSTRTC